MKIALFTEIYDCGGIDTFIINLINQWPHPCDSFVIIANDNYPGLKLIEARVERACEIIRHDMLVYPNFLQYGKRLPFLNALKKILSPLSHYLLIANNIVLVRKLLKTANPDRLMVINGGYPGGDSCRAAGIAWGLFSGKPFSIHNYHNIVMPAPWYFGLQEYFVDRLLCRFTESFVTVSQAAASSMAVRPTVFARKKPSYIHNGISSPPVESDPVVDIRKEIGITPDTPLCLMLGTYEPRKGHEFLFQAFRKVLEQIPETHLLICGFGFPHEIRHVQTRAKEYKLEDNIHLMGFRSDSSHLLRQADVLVVASQSYESFNFTSVEAMAHHLPVVATNTGGIPEVVANDEGGYCIDKNDADAYAQAIVRLLRDEDLRREQATRGHSRYLQLFTSGRMAADYAKIVRADAGRASTVSRTC